MIKTIMKFTVENAYWYKVLYNSGRRVDYNMHQNLPLTVLEYMLSAECETRYTDTGKVEYFKMEARA